MKRKFFVTLFVLLVVSMLFTACQPAQNTPAEEAAPEAEEAPAQEEAAPVEEEAAPAEEEAAPAEEEAVVSDDAEKKILRVAYGREIDVLNAFTSQNLCDIEFTMVEGLITTDATNTFIPVLAKEIPTFDNDGIVDNGDGTYDMTWNLYEGVYWHDGVEFTSKDVCFTWETIVSEGSEVYNRDDYLGITGCEMPDDYTVVFNWDGLYGYYAGLFEAMLPEHILGGMTATEIVSYEPYNRGEETIGTGPFKFAEWKPGEYIRVERNDNYWRGEQYPLVDEIVFMFIPDDNTRFNALQSGEYHYGEINAVQVKDFQAEGMTVNSVPSNVIYHFEGNVNTPENAFMFEDQKVRQALIYAVDRESIANDLMEGTVTVANSPLNPVSPFYNPDVPKYEYNPDKALELLAEAGWTDSDGDGILDKDGVPFAFTIMNRSGRADRIAIAEVIQYQLGQIGIEVDFETLESAAWTGRWRAGEWDAIVSGWFFGADSSLTNTYSCEGSNNMTGFCDPALDEVMRESDGYVTFEERKPLLDEAQMILGEDAHSMFLYNTPHITVVSDSLKNFASSGTNLGDFWNVYEWDIE